MMLVRILGLAVFLMGFNQALQAQLGFAVAKSKSGSSLDYALVINEGYQTEYLAKEDLKARGYQRVYNLNGGTDRGHNLRGGYYIIVKAERKNYLGKKIISYGLGASEESSDEAKKNALSNLQQYDWSWKELHGYAIIEEGRF